MSDPEKVDENNIGMSPDPTSEVKISVENQGEMLKTTGGDVGATVERGLEMELVVMFELLTTTTVSIHERKPPRLFHCG